MATGTSARGYRILNVFSVEGQRLSGNPLCVFEDGRGLEDAVLQALARQLNLSETTFILPPTTAGADARVRIFTPTFEMPFAGHPTLGTAHVVATLAGGRERVTLEMKAGLVEVRREGASWTLRTARGRGRGQETRPVAATAAEIAAMLGLGPDVVAGTPLWVDTGAEQLVIPLRSAADVAKAAPHPELLRKHAFSERRGASMAYVWAPAESGSADIVVRFFFLSHGSVIEDPATGSACANLGGFFLATGRALPLALRLSQGEAVARPSRLELRIDAEGQIFVSGRVEDLGGGSFVL
jgi:PhzF family phenazine biosynthesis protein